MSKSKYEFILKMIDDIEYAASRHESLTEALDDRVTKTRKGFKYGTYILDKANNAATPTATTPTPTRCQPDKLFQ